MRRARGFTLVELLVAISILALVAVLGWRGLDGIIRARVALTAQMEQTRGMQLAFAQLQSDCEHLAASPALHGRQNLSVGSNRLAMVRHVDAENQAGSLQVVLYRVRDGQLTRRQSAATRDLIALDTLWQAALGDEAAGADEVVLQGGVSALQARIWEKTEGQGGWRSAAGSAAAPRSSPEGRPTGLEVALRLAGQEASLLKLFLLGAV